MQFRTCDEAREFALEVLADVLNDEDTVNWVHSPYSVPLWFRIQTAIGMLESAQTALSEASLTHAVMTLNLAIQILDDVRGPASIAVSGALRQIRDRALKNERVW